MGNGSCSTPLSDCCTAVCHVCYIVVIDGMVMMLNTEQGSSSVGSSSRGSSASAAVAAAAATKGRHSCQLTNRRSFNPSGGAQYCVDISEGWLATGGESNVVRTWDFTAAADMAARAAANKAARNSRKNRRKGAAGAAAAAGGGAGGSNPAAGSSSGGGSAAPGPQGGHVGSSSAIAAASGAGKRSNRLQRDVSDRGAADDEGNDHGNLRSGKHSTMSRRGHSGTTPGSAAAAVPPHVYSSSPAQYGSSPSGCSSSGYSESPGSRMGSSPLQSPPVFMGGRHSYHQSHQRRQQQQQQPGSCGSSGLHDGTPPNGGIAPNGRYQQYNGFSSSPGARGASQGGGYQYQQQQHHHHNHHQQQHGSSPGAMGGSGHYHHVGNGVGHWGPRYGSSYPGAGAPLPWPVTGSSPRTSTSSAAPAAAPKHRLHQQQQRGGAGEGDGLAKQAVAEGSAIAADGGCVLREGVGSSEAGSAAAAAAVQEDGETVREGLRLRSSCLKPGGEMGGEREGAVKVVTASAAGGCTSGRSSSKGSAGGMVSWQLPNRTRSRGESKASGSSGSSGSGESGSGNSSGS